jgi:acetoin utilization protein AcuB
MLVGERMSRPVITIRPEMSVPDALVLMKKEHKRRFPVVDGRGKLLGMVSQNDLLNASASNVTTLSVWELNYLLSRITIEQVMKTEVITITEDTPIEEAARVMADHKIGSLPVVRGQEVVGIITETDLFKMFLELFGARYAGVRFSLLMEDRPGKLSELTEALHKVGANILAIGSFLGETSGTAGVVIKVEGVDQEGILKAIQPHVLKVLDVRLTRAG